MHTILPLSPLNALYIITISLLSPLLHIDPPPLGSASAEEWDEEGEQWGIFQRREGKDAIKYVYQYRYKGQSECWNGPILHPLKCARRVRQLKQKQLTIVCTYLHYCVIISY